MFKLKDLRILGYLFLVLALEPNSIFCEAIPSIHLGCWPEALNFSDEIRIQKLFEDEVGYELCSHWCLEQGIHFSISRVADEGKLVIIGETAFPMLPNDHHFKIWRKSASFANHLLILISEQRCICQTVSPSQIQFWKAGILDNTTCSFSVYCPLISENQNFCNILEKPQNISAVSLANSSSIAIYTEADLIACGGTSTCSYEISEFTLCKTGVPPSDAIPFGAWSSCATPNCNVTLNFGKLGGIPIFVNLDVYVSGCANLSVVYRSTPSSWPITVGTIQSSPFWQYNRFDLRDLKWISLESVITIRLESNDDDANADILQGIVFTFGDAFQAPPSTTEDYCGTESPTPNSTDPTSTEPDTTTRDQETSPFVETTTEATSLQPSTESIETTTDMATSTEDTTENTEPAITSIGTSEYTTYSTIESTAPCLTTTESEEITTEHLTTEIPEVTTLVTTTEQIETSSELLPTSTSNRMTSEPGHRPEESSTEGRCGPGRLPCEATDRFGVLWKGCGGILSRKECPNNTTNENGICTWFCREDGSFHFDHPDFENCTNRWISDIVKEITPGEPLNETRADELITLIHLKAKEKEYFGHEIGPVAYLNAKVISQIDNIPFFKFQNLTGRTFETFGNMLAAKERWEEMFGVKRLQTGNLYLQSLENAGLELSYRAMTNTNNSYHKGFYMSQDSMRLLSGVQLKGNSTVSYKCWESRMSLPTDWSDYFEQKQIQFVGLGITRNQSAMIFPEKYSNRDPENGQILNSVIMGFSFGAQRGFDLNIKQRINSPSSSLRFEETPKPQSLNFTGQGVKIWFEHDQAISKSQNTNLRRKRHPGETLKPVLGSANCIYWDTGNLDWSPSGCKLLESNKSGSLCECFHLTSFSILMDVHNYIGKDVALEILTLSLGPISLLCLLAAIVVFTMVRQTHGARTTITKNLCISLFLGNLFVLITVDRHYLNLSEGMCLATAMLTHYIFLVAFMWMAIQGYHLYRQIVHVYDTETSSSTIYRILAFGAPLLIVGGTELTSYLKESDAYGGELFCWLEGNYIWAFMAPVAIICLGNTIVLIVILRVAYKVNSPDNKIQKRVRSYKSLVKGSLSITFILGLTWITGFFMLVDSISSNIAAYVFTILNSSQGIFLFVFHCLLNEKVRVAAFRKFFGTRQWFSTKTTDSSLIRN